MLPLRIAIVAALVSRGSDPGGSVVARSEAPDLKPIACSSCDDWNEPQVPFRLHGRSFYVGTKGLSVVVVDTGRGLVLLDGALPQSVPRIVANLSSLQLRITDVRWILMSHAHYDHVGGIAALARASGARVMASPLAAAALRAGHVMKDDPQHPSVPFPLVPNVVELEAATVRLGDVTFTKHDTPGHTPGGSTWSWKSCDARGCVNMVYADSLNPISSAPGFQFSRDPASLGRFRAAIKTVRSLPCDILVSVHPGFSGLFEKQERRRSSHTTDPLIDPGACRRYADGATKALDSRLVDERR